MTLEEKKILIVDDEEIMREYLCDVFEDQGFCVEKAASGEEAIEKIDTGFFADLIITDLKMLGISGIELIQYARRKNNLMKAILMTAYSLDLTKQEYLIKERCDYILKPFEINQVREKVFSAFKNDER